MFETSMQESHLPIPELPESESCLHHSFKQHEKRRSSEKAPRLHLNTSFSNQPFQLISLKNDEPKCSDHWNSTLLQNSDSYFDSCFDHLAKIGEGSFSEVFKVRSKEDGKLYAIKKSIRTYRSESYRERTLDEVRYLETFSDYKNCVTLYKAWEQKGHLYMQLELCDTLESRMKTLKNITEDFYWGVMLDILLAVKALHDRDLIHLDVKLDNILIDEHNVCKLGDFGLVVDAEKAKINEPTEGDCRYIAPEILEGNFSKAADIFSLGITMLELLTNLDLQGNGPLWQELRTGILPSICLELMSNDFQNVIQWMMNPLPSQRPDVNCLLSWPRLKKELDKRHELSPKIKKEFESRRQLRPRRSIELKHRPEFGLKMNLECQQQLRQELEDEFQSIFPKPILAERKNSDRRIQPIQRDDTSFSATHDSSVI